MKKLKDEYLSYIPTHMVLDHLKMPHLLEKDILGKCRINFNGEIEVADDAFSALFPTQSQVIGASIYDLIVSNDHAKFQQYLTDSQQSEGGFLTYIQFNLDIHQKQWFHLKAQSIRSMGASDGYIINIISSSYFNISNSLPESIAFVKGFYDLYEMDWNVLSQVLRDDIAQELYAVRMYLQRFILQHGFKNEIDPVKKMLSGTIYKLTETANHLSPPLVESTTYIDLIKDIMFLLQRSGYEVTYLFGEKLQSKEPVILLTLFRIIQSFFVHWMSIQERHTINICLEVIEDRIILIIKEKGDIDRFESFYDTNFLLNIKNRILVYTGTIEVKALPKQSELTLVMYN
jgi:hypothetical protein